MKLSARNTMPGTVTKVTKGAVNAEVDIRLKCGDVVVSIITMKIADWIIDSRVGALDRTLGFLYGAARGILVVAAA